ncbi:MAG: NUDIX hydrolase [Caulobacteraceae bacterium]|nr:NUDIX hydrolase [Caulobacter sp.]
MADAPPPPPPAWLRPHGRPWTSATGPRPVHENPWFMVEAHQAIAPTGASTPYFVHRPRHLATGVVPLHDDGTVTLVGQWRFPLGRYGWEIPEGGAPHGEPPLEGCRRELREEAGLEAAHWREILVMELSNSSSDELAHVFLATGLSPCPAAPEATEELAQARAPFREALHAAVTGRVQDAITVAALLRVHHMAAEGELEPALAKAVLG